MTMRITGKLQSKVEDDADSQKSLEPSTNYGSHQDVPRFSMLNQFQRSGLDHQSFGSRGPYQETAGRMNSYGPPGMVPEEAAASCPHVTLSGQEVRFIAGGASGSHGIDQQATHIKAAPPHPQRSVSAQPPRNTSPELVLNRSKSVRSFRGECGEGTMHPTENMANSGIPSREKPREDSQYAEVTGVNNKKYRVYYKDVEVPEEMIPVRFKDQYDIALLYADADLDEAMALRSFFYKFCRTDTGEIPKVCTIDYNPDMMEGSKIQHIEDALHISTYVFLLITKNFCQDRWSALQKDECLMASLRDPYKRWCIVPVLTQKKGVTHPDKAYNIPFGLQSLKPIDISRITWGESMVNLMRDDPEEGEGAILTMSEIRRRDKFFLEFFNAMLSRKLSIRKLREHQVTMDRELFIHEAKRRLAEKQAQRMAEEDAHQYYRQQERTTWEQQLKQRIDSGAIAESYNGHAFPGMDMRGPPRSSHVAQVEAGPAYHYHFYQSEGLTVPQMPVGKQTTVNVQGGNIVQVGDYNTATALSQDEESDIYVPDTDVPLQRHLTPSNSRPEEPMSSSDSEEDLYNSQVSNKEAMYRQEEFARQPMMEPAKSIGSSFDDICSTQAKEEASINLKHMSNPSSTHLKDTPATELEKDFSNLSNGTFGIATSATGMKSISIDENWKEASSLPSQNSGPTTVPAPRSHHIRPAQGSPTEDETHDALPRLYIPDQNDNPSSNIGRNIGDIDTSADPPRGKKAQKTEDYPSLSERVVLGQEREPDVVPPVKSGASSMAAAPNDSLSSQMSLLEDVVQKEKKEAQSEFQKKYFQELLQKPNGSSDVNQKAPESDPIGADVSCGGDSSAPSMESVTFNSDYSLSEDMVYQEKKEAQSKYVDEYLSELLRRNTNIGSSPAMVNRGEVANVRYYPGYLESQRSNYATGQTNGTLAEHDASWYNGYGDARAFDRTVSCNSVNSLRSNESDVSLTSLENFLEKQKQDMAGIASLNESSVGTEKEDTLASLQNFLEQQKQDIAGTVNGNGRVMASGESLTSLENFMARQKQDVALSLNGPECSVSLEELEAYIKSQQRDMARPRQIQQKKIEQIEMDGGELPSGYRSINNVFPHHIDSQYVLGHPITSSVRSGSGYNARTEEDFD